MFRTPRSVTRALDRAEQPDRVTGRVAITRTWSLTLPGEFDRSMEHGLLRFSKRSLEVRVTAHANPDPSAAAMLDRLAESTPSDANFVKRSVRADGSSWLTYEARESAGSIVGISIGRRTLLSAHGVHGAEYVALEISARDRAGLGDGYAIVTSCGRG